MRSFPHSEVETFRLKINLNADFHIWILEHLDSSSTLNKFTRIIPTPGFGNIWILNQCKRSFPLPGVDTFGFWTNLNARCHTWIWKHLDLSSRTSTFGFGNIWILNKFKRSFPHLDLETFGFWTNFVAHFHTWIANKFKHWSNLSAHLHTWIW